MSTNQYYAAIAFAGSLASFGLPGPNTKFPARRGNILDAVAFNVEKVEAIGFDLVHLWRDFGVYECLLAEGHPLSLRLGLLDCCVGTEGTLSPTAAARAFGRAALLGDGREHFRPVDYAIKLFRVGRWIGRRCGGGNEVECARIRRFKNSRGELIATRGELLVARDGGCG